ncbi:MAG TPA: ABC transporter substrate-binding protein, partial [Candidatus Nitrosocosmicus sp.]
KIHAIIVFSLAFSLLFSNLFILSNAQRINKTPPIKMGITVWVPNFLAYVAQEKGIFKKNNVDVNLTLLQNYGDVIKAYSNGEMNGIFTVYSDAIIQHSSGVNTKVVYNVDSSFKADAIVGKGNSLLDVKGKNISVDGINSFSHLFVLKSLEKVGLNEGDVEFVNIPVQNVSEELQKGHIFAGHTYEPFVSDAVKKGFKILSTGADVPGIITNVLAFHSDIVQQRPQDIQNIVKSMIEAKADYDKNKEQDISIMASKSGLSKDQIIEGINNVKLLDLNYNIQNSMNRTSTNTTSLYVSGNYFAKFYSERGVISEYPNIDDLVDPQFVTALFKAKISATK